MDDNSISAFISSIRLNEGTLKLDKYFADDVFSRAKSKFDQVEDFYFLMQRLQDEPIRRLEIRDDFIFRLPMEQYGAFESIARAVRETLVEFVCYNDITFTNSDRFTQIIQLVNMLRVLKAS